jgi:hypothetical protein
MCMLTKHKKLETHSVQMIIWIYQTATLKYISLSWTTKNSKTRKLKWCLLNIYYTGIYFSHWINCLHVYQIQKTRNTQCTIIYEFLTLPQFNIYNVYVLNKQCLPSTKKSKHIISHTNNYISFSHCHLNIYYFIHWMNWINYVHAYKA